MKFYLKNNLQPRSPIRIFHQKLSGKTVQIELGYIQTIEKDPEHPIRVLVKRHLKQGGTV